MTEHEGRAREGHGETSTVALTWPPRLVLATHNEGKAREFAALVPSHVQVTTSRELGLSAPDEDGDGYVANARLKAARCAAATGLPALADDTGAELDALGGAPGVDTAPWVASHGGWTRALELAAEAAGVRGEGGDAATATEATAPSRAATLCCALVLRWPDGTECAVQARVPGRLRWPPLGPANDGFATIFVPDTPSPSLDGHGVVVQPHRRAAFAKLDALLRGE